MNRFPRVTEDLDLGVDAVNGRGTGEALEAVNISIRARSQNAQVDLAHVDEVQAGTACQVTRRHKVAIADEGHTQETNIAVTELTRCVGLVHEMSSTEGA